MAHLLAPPVPPVPLAAPTKFADLYRSATDVMLGDYGPFFSAYSTPLDATQGTSPASMKDATMAMSEDVPKVFLYMTTEAGAPVIRTLFRPKVFPAVPGRVTPWDGDIFAFATDLSIGNQITTVHWPPTAFHRTAQVRAPDVASMEAAWLVNPASLSLGPFDPNDASTELTRTRFMMPVPPAYIHLVFGGRFTPRALWTKLGVQIITDTRAVSCEPLLTWLRVASTVVAPQVAGQPDLEPLMLTPAPAFPLADEALASHRWQLVLRDMPSLAGAATSQEQAVTQALHAIHQNNIAAANAASLDRAESKAPKLPSSKYPMAVDKLLRITAVSDERNLPEIWQRLANCKKGEARSCIEDAIQKRCREPGAATSNAPIVTKEIGENFSAIKFASAHPDVLTDGVQVFHFVPTRGQKRTDKERRAVTYDLIISGDGAATLGDLQLLSDPMIDFPTSLYELTAALQGLSVADDVAYGAHHPYTIYLRQWIVTDWIRNEGVIRDYIAQMYANDEATACTRFACYLGLRLNQYKLNLEQVGVAATPLPDLDNFTRLIQHRENPFPPLPSMYRTVVPPVAPRAPGPSPSTPAPVPPARTPARTPAGECLYVEVSFRQCGCWKKIRRRELWLCY